MSDAECRVASLRNDVSRFVSERDWDRFHEPRNLAESVSIEAAELLELFQWGQVPDQGRVSEELADVIIYCISMANSMGLDISDIVADKLAKNRVKYPV